MNTTCRATRAGTSVMRVARHNGFTLVELVVVLVVLSVLAVVAVPRFFDQSVFDERAWYDEVATALRYARSVAIASGCPVLVQLGATSYELKQQVASAGHCDSSDLSFPVAVRLVDGQPASATAPPGVVLSPPGTIVFDAAGRTDLAADLSISINAQSMVIYAGSGYTTP